MATLVRVRSPLGHQHGCRCSSKARRFHWLNCIVPRSPPMNHSLTHMVTWVFILARKFQSCWRFKFGIWAYPIGSMHGIFTYIYHRNQPNVGKYTIHGFYGYLRFLALWYFDLTLPLLPPTKTREAFIPDRRMVHQGGVGTRCYLPIGCRCWWFRNPGEENHLGWC